jgi:DNA modification methylase
MLGDVNNGVSLLDPVLAEIVVHWFGMKNGLAFDPFAGDTVFGFVAGTKGMAFQGIELRQEQAKLNQQRCDEAKLPCVYYNDTSENMDEYIVDNSVDLVFSCPPYADLEVYSDDPKDLSNMSHDDFFQVYKRILQNTYAKLKDNRFAVIIMGEVRGKKGSYIGTIPKTIEIMESAGYSYYNEIVLINSAGTLPLRAGKAMQAPRKVGKMHQNVLVFVKGNPKAAAEDLGEIKVDLGESDAN